MIKLCNYVKQSQNSEWRVMFSMLEYSFTRLQLKCDTLE